MGLAEVFPQIYCMFQDCRKASLLKCVVRFLVEILVRYSVKFHIRFNLYITVNYILSIIYVNYIF